MSRTSQEKEMPFLDHLEELRWRILKSLAAIFVFSVGCFFVSETILNFLTEPALRLRPTPTIIFLSPAGMFMVRMEVALAGGLLVALPVVFYQIWQFVIPALLDRERKFALPIVLFSTLCFLVGAAFAYCVVIPQGLNFLLGLRTEAIEPQLDVGKYVGFVSKIVLAFGLIFELPLLSFFLSRIGLITPRFLRRNRPYAVIVIFVVAALLTPPDVLTQLAMAGPLLILYEVSIGVSALARRMGKVER